MPRIYFDNAATTPIAPEVLAHMSELMGEVYGNPSSIHAEGRRARTVVEQARRSIAKHLNASIGEIFFTSCGSESNNMVLKGAVRDLGVRRIISAPTEHHCVLHAAEALRRDAGIELLLLDVDAQGHVDLAQLEAWLRDASAKTLVSLMHANNEVGTLLPLAEVAALCAAHGALFHSDTVQTVGHYPIDLSRLPIGFISGSAHKFHGPKGVGFVYINSANMLRPFIDGGSQERNMRGGTENIYGIAGMAKAFEAACAEMGERRAHIEGLRRHLRERLEAEFEDVAFNGDWAQGLYTVLSVSFPPSPRADLLVLNLDIAGVSASGGSACSSGVEQESHVLAAMQPDSLRRTVRFSFSHYNTLDEVEAVVGHLKALLRGK